MKALTLHRPWPWAILHLPAATAKRVENRDWPPPRSLFGERFAIHAGRTFDVSGALWIEREFGVRVPPPSEHPIGLVGSARIAGMRDHASAVWWKKPSEGEPRTVSIKRGAVPPPGTHDGGRWFVGAYGWLLDDVVALPEPIACKGAQGLWTVSADVLARIQEVSRG